MKKLAKLAALIAAFALALTLGACSEEYETTGGTSINITFDANGGSITTSTFSDTSVYGTKQIPTAQTLGLNRTAYTFLGWATSENATKAEYEDGAYITVPGKTLSLTLYAVWKQGYAATESTVADVIKSLTTDATVVVTGRATHRDSTWGNIAKALAAVSSVKVTLDFSEVTTSEVYNFWYRGSSSTFKNTTNLVAVVLPDGYRSGLLFSNCASLASVSVSDDSKKYTSVDGVLYSKDKTELVLYPAGKTATSFTVPDTVTTIAEYAFCENKNLTEVTTPDGIDTIKSYAFQNMTALATVTLGADLTTIEPNAFYGCSALKKAMFNNKICYWIITGNMSTTPQTSSCTVNTNPGDAAEWLTNRSGYNSTYNYCDYYWLSPFGTITFDANGGTITATETTQRYKYGLSIELKTSDELGLTRSGYTFKGWAKTANATTADYPYPANTYYPHYSANGDYDVTLYAVWKVNAE